jgi:glycosyltransferase involved in cell wall biosynthesis
MKPQPPNAPIRVLYSFPHKLGAARICTTAWHQVEGIAAAGAEVTVLTGCVSRPLPPGIKVHTTFAWKKLRIPYKILGGRRMCALHDWLVARKLRKLAGQVDLVHLWPTAALHTIRTAAKLGIPTVLERPNAHTRFAYEVVQEECDRLGVPLPPNHEHAYNADVLRREEAEYEQTDKLLCPSDFVVKTFMDRGIARQKLVRHIYGYDEGVYYPNGSVADPKRGLSMLFVGVCAVRKGVHYALEAWLKSSAHEHGTFQIAGEFLPAYAAKLAPMLAHPSVKVLGHRRDVPALMRASDILVLPSIEEGFGLVVAEAMGSGCVPLISDACADICKHGENGMIHHVGDVQALTQQINQLDQDRALLARLRAASLRDAPGFTWKAAGVKVVEAYQQILAAEKSGRKRT